MQEPSTVAVELDSSGIRRSDQSAISTPERSIGYQELNSAVASVATAIVERLDSAPWLPIVVDRSIDSAIAILASIRAGRPFVPIDSALPPARIHELLRIAGGPSWAVIGHSALAGTLPAEIRTLTFERHLDVVEPPRGVDRDSPGCLLFTSGSTGAPKGVVRRWAGFDRDSSSVRSVEYSASHRGSMLSPMNFLGGLTRICQVASGDPICLVDPRQYTLETLVDWLASQSITHARLGGAHVDALLRQKTIDRRLPTAIEFTLFGSRRDWSQVPLIRKLCSPDVTAANSYASTEAGSVSRFLIGPECDIGSGRIPSGSLPIDRLRLVECEEGQEIWVRDPDALEYLGDTELTSKRFVTDEDGARWWRSGDIGRVDDDGNFYFVGRVDLMIKINGMRIEPEETEHALRSVSGVTSAAVVASPTSNGSHRLVGHICVDDESLTPRSVKEQLEALLPSHLVPAILVRHDSLPYTDRQKLDRQRLLSLPVERWKQQSEPRKFSLESHWIASKVEEVIGLGDIAPDDDMWEAGLDSMGAVELCSIIASEGHSDIDPRLLLVARTPEELERQLGVRRKDGATNVVVFNEQGTLTPIFAIPGTTGTAFAYRSLSESLGNEQPVVVVEPRGMHDTERIERSVEERVATFLHVVNKKLEHGKPCLIVSHSGGSTYAFEAARTLRESGRNVHVIFLDGIPRDSTTGNYKPAPIRRTNTVGTGAASPFRAIRLGISLLRREPQKLWRIAMMPLLVRFPGKRRFTVDHYRNFWWIERRVLRKYTLRPASISATLLHVGKGDLPERGRVLVESLDSHLVGGDHISMLYPPYIREIADHVVRIREQLAAGS